MKKYIYNKTKVKRIKKIYENRGKRKQTKIMKRKKETKKGT